MKTNKTEVPWFDKRNGSVEQRADAVLFKGFLSYERIEELLRAYDLLQAEVEEYEQIALEEGELEGG